MRIMVLGADGYLGWPTCLHLSASGHQVFALDSGYKRATMKELRIRALHEVDDFVTRAARWNNDGRGQAIKCYEEDICQTHTLPRLVRALEPDAIVHYAEQPSAPYSMMDQRRAVETQRHNIVGTLNLIYACLGMEKPPHIVKLGTMGEYGTPKIPIEEGWLDVEHKGYSDRVLYPKKPGSWYHLSKVHDSHNLEFACRNWGLAVTDLNQGPVYGQSPLTGPGTETQFHYDAIFGTVLNRFLVQAVIGHPLTVYGTGGQTRGFIDIRDTVECIRIACEAPAAPGEFRVFNQITQLWSINDLAELVQLAVQDRDIVIEHLPNPRVEEEDHMYQVTYQSLIDMGLDPHILTPGYLWDLYRMIRDSKHTIDSLQLRPNVKWR